MSSESTIINNTTNSIGFSSFEGINRNLNSKNSQLKTKKNLDIILEKKGENKYITNSKILKIIKNETRKNDFCNDNMCENEEKVQVNNTNSKILLPKEKEKKNTNVISLKNENKKILNTEEIKIEKNIAEIAQKKKLDKMEIKKLGKDFGKINNKNNKNLNSKILEIKKTYNYIKKNNNEEENNNKIPIDSLNTNKYSNNSKKIFDDEDMKIEMKMQKGIKKDKKNERYQKSSESSSFNLNENINNLINKISELITQNKEYMDENKQIRTKLDIIISQNKALLTHFNIKIEEPKSDNKNSK